jgi:hypothetical protein
VIFAGKPPISMADSAAGGAALVLKNPVFSTPTTLLPLGLSEASKD